ncbi:acid-sensing ion channel 1A-like isoform X1 [Lineus longissimus]|uniref:acid-sensing ion channel 1A-like isoform X1 n=1 Tax=Lineus longissimus TaxID=88925 RepID=UPI00315DB0B1
MSIDIMSTSKLRLTLFDGGSTLSMNEKKIAEPVKTTRIQAFNGPVVKTDRWCKFYTSFCTRVNLGGLNKLIDGEYGLFRRMIWLVFILGMTAFGLYQMCSQIAKYNQRPITVLVNISRYDHVKFPAITVCNFNIFAKRKTDKVYMTDYVKAILLEKKSLLALPALNKQIIANGWSWWENYKLLGHRLHDSLLACDWKQKPCDYDDFEETITDMGWCFQFNSNTTTPSLSVNNAGTDYGLLLHLDTELDQYIGSRHGFGEGFKILAHDRNDIPLMKSAGIAVGPGMQTFIGIKQKRIKKIGPPHGTCGSRKLKEFTHYSTSACQLECLTEYMGQKCGCKDAYQLGSYPDCTPEEMYKCGLKAQVDFVTDTNETCIRERCPDQCETTTFEMEVSTVPIADWFFEEKSADFYIDKNITYLRKNLALVFIYYTSMNVEETVQNVAYTEIDMICDIGGSFGLALGASIITGLEICDFFVYYFFTRHLSGGVKPA